MSKLLANQIANYGDDAPIEIKEGLNIPAGKPIEAAGISGASGQVLTSTGTSISWTTPFNGNYNTLTNKPTIPAAQVNADWNASGGVAVILNKPTVPPLTSLTVNSAGTANLSFNAANGEFTYTPPDVSNYNTAFGWGDHSSAGYLTAEADTFNTVHARSTFNYSNTITNRALISNSVVNGGVWDFLNDVHFFGSGDGIYVGANTRGFRFLDFDDADDALVDTTVPNGRGTNTSKDTFVMLYRRSSSSGYNMLGTNTMYLQTKPNADGEATKLSIGNDTGVIQLGNNASTISYLEASATATKLFHNGSEKLTTTTTGIDLGSNDLVTTGKLLYSNNYANTGDLPSATTYHGMFAHVHAEGHGYFAHAGAWTQLLDAGSSIDELADVNLATAPQSGQVLAYDGSNWVATAAGGGGGGIALTDISVTSATAGTPSLSYNNVSGVFTYTPPDLSGYLTSETDPVFGASPAAGILSSNISNWDTAYGWGNHASAGYLVATAQDKTNWNLAYGWGNHASAGYLTSLGDAAGVTTAKISNWDTAYGWGDHGAANYLTTLALNGVSDVTITSPQTNDVLTYNGSGWVNSAPTGGGGNTQVTISDTIPAGTATAGDLWWESDTGRLKIYYTDTDSSQWVDTNPPLAPALSSNAPAAANSGGSEGDIRFDSNYVYICVAANTWKRAAIATW